MTQKLLPKLFIHEIEYRGVSREIIYEENVLHYIVGVKNYIVWRRRVFFLVIQIGS